MGNSPTKVDDIKTMNSMFRNCIKTCKDIEKHNDNGNYSYTNTKKDKVIYFRPKYYEYCITDCRKGWRLIQRKILIKYQHDKS